jgi:cytoskeletal protein CcmA (bactofilin family)
VNKIAPTADLDVNGTTRTTFLRVEGPAGEGQLEVGALTFTDNSITSSTGTLRFEASGGEATVYHARLQVKDFQISGNTISTTVTNRAINIQPDGLGSVNIVANTNITGDLDVTGSINATGNITLGGNIIVGDNLANDTLTVNAKIGSNLIPKDNISYDLGDPSYKWKDLYTNNLYVATEFQIADFTISGNTIATSANSITFDTPIGQSVIFNAALVIDALRISTNTISSTTTNSPIVLNPNGVGTIELQANTNVTGNLGVTGNIQADGNITIGGDIIIGNELTDNIEINAAIKSDLIPQADNTYDLGSSSFKWRDLYVTNFYTNNIDLTALNIGNVTINNNEISTTSGQNLVIDGNGTGGVQLGNFRIVDNVITNIVSGAVSQIAQSGTGYFKIAGTNGFVPPVGNDAQRPTAYAVLGMTRFNTFSKALEVWDGAAWSSPAGSSGSVSFNQAEDIAVQIALTLG